MTGGFESRRKSEFDWVAARACWIPDKPKGMHWRTYDRLCRVHDAAEERSIIG